ncbi:MAG: 40S ribosomal protein S19 [Thermoplasmata archaeon]
MAAEYGGKVDRGTKPYHAKKGSRSIVRKCLQQLESLGFVEKNKKGRVISPKGRSYLDKLSEEILKKGS